MKDHGNWIAFEGLLLWVPMAFLALLGALPDAIEPMFRSSPIASCATSFVGLFTCLAIPALATLGFVYLACGPVALRSFSRLAWLLAAIGAFIAISAALSTYIIPPSREYTDMYWFRESLRLYSLGCVLLVPFAHFSYLASREVQESTKPVEPTGTSTAHD